jgi:hypothetical protein
VRARKASGQVTDSPATRPAPDTSAVAARNIGRIATTVRAARQQPQPPAAPDPFTLERLGPWEILRRDATGKRAVARCANCQTVREISVVDGCIASCGCARARTPGASEPPKTKQQRDLEQALKDRERYRRARGLGRRV